MIIFFDDEAGFINNYIRSTEASGWETSYAPTVERLLEYLDEIESRNAELDDDPHVIVVDIMFPVRVGIAAEISSRLEVGISVIDQYLLKPLRERKLTILILTNKNPMLVKASLLEIGVKHSEIPIMTKNEVSAALFPQRLDEFLSH